MRRLAAALLVAAAPGLAQAQFATIAPTAPLLDNGDRIANTAFVNNFFSNLPLAQGKIYIGNAGNIASQVTPSGDCTISILGVITCTQAAGNFTIVGNLTVGGTTTGGGLATFNTGVTINGTLTVNGVIIDRNGGITVNGVKQPQFTSLLPLTGGGVVYQDRLGGLNVVQSPFPNKILMSGFKGNPPFWGQTTWADSYPSYSLLYSNGPNNVQALAPGTDGQMHLGQTNLAPAWKTMSGDATLAAGGALTLASTISAGGPTGSATVAPIITYDAKGRLTTVSSATITPAVGSITGLGTGVATFLGTPSSANLRGAITDETGTGAAYFQGGDLGTPSAGVLTNATGLPLSGIASASWSTYTPSVTCGAGTITTLGAVSGRYTQISKTILYQFDVAITTIGTCATDLRITLPVSTVQASTVGNAREQNSTGKMGFANAAAGSNFAIVGYYDNTFIGASGARIVGGGVYEIP